jgi:nitrate reductase gamma subunit
MFDLMLFVALPYAAIAVAVAGGIYRYREDRFSFSSHSTQMLENRSLFWGSVPWHYGIVLLLIGHLIGLVFPQGVAAWNGNPLRLYILEVTALGLALFSLFGLGVLMWRRLAMPRARVVTTPVQWVSLGLLLLVVVTGIWTAVLNRWGSYWYVSNAVPYLLSLLTFNPQVEHATSLPVSTQIHTVATFLLVGIFPFSRLVHIFTLPITYLWRPYQTVIWNRRRRPEH